MSARPGKPAHATAADCRAAVDAFMKTLDHPHKAAIATLRKVVAGAAPGIQEGVKWNAPSFRTTEYFATVNLREKAGIGLILHLGARLKAPPASGLAIADPQGLLKWLARDRAMIVIRDARDLAARRTAIAVLVREWVAQV